MVISFLDSLFFGIVDFKFLLKSQRQEKNNWKFFDHELEVTFCLSYKDNEK